MPHSGKCLDCWDVFLFLGTKTDRHVDRIELRWDRRVEYLVVRVRPGIPRNKRQSGYGCPRSVIPFVRESFRGVHSSPIRWVNSKVYRVTGRMWLVPLHESRNATVSRKTC